MRRTLKVRPATGRDGEPKIVPRAPGVVLGLRAGETWPAQAIARDGEEIQESRFITELLRSGDLVEVVGAEEPPTPTKPKVKSKPKGQGEE